MPKLAILVLGEAKSGKSSVWNTLFGRTVKTGKFARPLKMGAGIKGNALLVNGYPTVDIFLISGSPEETGKPIQNTLANVQADVVLCSVQYIAHARITIDYFINGGFDVKVMWLNPGMSDSRTYFDYAGLGQYVLAAGAELSLESGSNCSVIAEEIREKIFGWVSYKI